MENPNRIILSLQRRIDGKDRSIKPADIYTATQ